MRDKLEKIILYLDLYEVSRNKEENIKTLPFYNLFGRYNQQKEELDFQQKVTAKIWHRIQTLKKEL